jgi:hypothetical protein
LNCFALFLIALALGISGVSAANGQTSTTAVPPTSVTKAPAATASMRGHIVDPSGALIPGATITVTTPDGAVVKSATADASGVYAVIGLAPGSYIVQSNVDGFAPFASQAIQISAGQVKRVDISMALEVEQQSVTVTDDTPQVSVEAGSNSDTVMLKGKDLDALSDDPDELSNELTALAGPSAGPNGGQIYIDGFSGGQLPPKSAIREIRINQNPFSAEYDHIGYGRIEILIKPGSDKLHGQFFIQGNDKAFNTGNPFTQNIPPYYSYQFNGNVSGALSKNASFSVSAEQRHTENVNTWSIPDAVLENGSGVYVDNLNYGVNLLNQRIRDNASARIDWQIGAKNTLTARYGYWSEAEHGDLNGNSLASDSWHETNTDHTVQISDAILINDHAANETRIQYERQNENHYPDLAYPDPAARTISVTGDFTGGGFPGQQSRDHATRLEFQNITTLTHGSHAIKFGTRMRDTRDANYTNANFNGSFTFDSPASYKAMANGLLSPTAPNTFATLVTAGYGPTSASYTTGQQSSLTNAFDMAFFAQDDWKYNDRLTLSGGIRWESQNHIADHSDWAPRVAVAYALDGGKDKKAKTVLRAGYGFFYDRFDVRTLRTINIANVQRQVVLNKPTCTDTATTLDDIDMKTCSSTGGTSTSSVPLKYEVAPNYHSPNTEQASFSLERQLNSGTSMTLNYMRTFGVHQQVMRNANQATGGTPQTNTGGYLYEYFPEAVFKENQLITSVNSAISKSLSLTAFYTLSFANANNNGAASNAYNLNNNYGRAGFIARNSLFLMSTYNGPWKLRFNPFVIAQSGRPYNITLSTDPLNNFFNQRPAYASSATACSTTSSTVSEYVQTAFGCLDTTPNSSETLLPINLGSGPAAVAVNLRISRGFGIGPKLASATSSSQDNSGGPPPGGPPPGGSHGGGGRGSGGGMIGGGMMGGGMSSGRKYTLTFSAQALNMFNDISRGQPNGTIIPTLNTSTGLTGPGAQFGQPNSMAGGIFSQGSAARRIYVQAVFSF